MFFRIWWIFHFLEIVFLHIVLNIWIYRNAKRNIEEFNGYISTRYPGQEKPQQAIISPRRPSHSPTKHFNSQVVISVEEEDSNILKCDYCDYSSPNYYDLLNHIQDDHKLFTAWGPVVVQ